MDMNKWRSGILFHLQREMGVTLIFWLIVLLIVAAKWIFHL
jgi:Tfp pilus assembly protein PilX